MDRYLTWTLDSGRFIFSATSSRMNISGYLVFWKSDSSTSSWAREKVVRSRRCLRGWGAGIRQPNSVRRKEGKEPIRINDLNIHPIETGLWQAAPMRRKAFPESNIRQCKHKDLKNGFLFAELMSFSHYVTVEDQWVQNERWQTSQPWECSMMLQNLIKPYSYWDSQTALGQECSGMNALEMIRSMIQICSKNNKCE